MRRWLTILASAAVLLGSAVAPAAGGALSLSGAQPAQNSSCAGGGGFSVVALGAAGARIARTLSIPVCARGGVTVTFAGDPATCSAAGLCAYAGSDAFSVQGAGALSLTTTRGNGHRATSATLFLPEGPVTSAVTRTPAPGAQFSCSDTPGEEGQGGGFFSIPPSAGSQVTIGLVSSASKLLGTRCAGPLTGDLRGALPTRTIGLKSLARGRRVIDLTGTGTFTAHGLTGTVRSSVVLVLGRPQPQPDSSGLPAGTRVARVREASVSDRVMGLTGQATAMVSTTPEAALCAPLDACGLAGTITVTPGALRGGSIELFASAPITRPLAWLRAALNLDRAAPPHGVTVFGAGQARLSGRVSADLAQGGICRDSTIVSGAVIETAVDRRGRLHVVLQALLTGAADPLRTRCPGPDLGQRSLAAAVVPREVWRRRTFAVLLHGASFADGPYRVTIDSTLRLALRRGRLSLRVSSMPEPVPPAG